MTKIVTWEGPEPVECRALQRAGGSPVVEPGESREVADELAESIASSADGWRVSAKPKPKPKPKAGKKAAEPEPAPDQPEEDVSDGA